MTFYAPEPYENINIHFPCWEGHWSSGTSRNAFFVTKDKKNSPLFFLFFFSLFAMVSHHHLGNMFGSFFQPSFQRVAGSMYSNSTPGLCCLNWGLYDPNPIFSKKKALKTGHSDKHRWAPLPSSSYKLDDDFCHCPGGLQARSCCCCWAFAGRALGCSQLHQHRPQTVYSKQI